MLDPSQGVVPRSHIFLVYSSRLPQHYIDVNRRPEHFNPSNEVNITCDGVKQGRYLFLYSSLLCLLWHESLELRMLI